jgi:hypothetical protein
LMRAASGSVSLSCYAAGMIAEQQLGASGFKEVARQLECDEDEARCDERREVVKAKPATDKPL